MTFTVPVLAKPLAAPNDVSCTAVDPSGSATQTAMFPERFE